MLDFMAGRYVLSWKNSPSDEDEDGQRVLWATSKDASTWSAPQVLFPNISAGHACPAAWWAAPWLELNGSIYAAASVVQFCLFPVDRTVARLVALRRVSFGAGSGRASLGDVFWASEAGPEPTCLAAAAAARGVRLLQEMDPQTQSDVRLLGLLSSGEASGTPCSSSSTKCEWCPHGCQPLARLRNKTLPGTNCSLKLPWLERTHYTSRAGDDYMLYESNEHELCFARRGAGTTEWSAPTYAAVPDCGGNANAGTHTSNGSTFNYLISNPVLQPAPLQRARNPLVISTSRDGVTFDRAYVVASCLLPPYSNPAQPDGCAMRHPGKGHGPGPQYPQGVGVPSLAKFSIAFSNNKEDIWVVTISGFPARD